MDSHVLYNASFGFRFLGVFLILAELFAANDSAKISKNTCQIQLQDVKLVDLFWHIPKQVCRTETTFLTISNYMHLSGQMVHSGVSSDPPTN